MPVSGKTCYARAEIAEIPDMGVISELERGHDLHSGRQIKIIRVRSVEARHIKQVVY